MVHAFISNRLDYFTQWLSPLPLLSNTMALNTSVVRPFLCYLYYTLTAVPTTCMDGNCPSMTLKLISCVTTAEPNQWSIKSYDRQKHKEIQEVNVNGTQAVSSLK